MKNTRARDVFIIISCFTLIACVLDSTLPNEKETLLTAFAFAGIFGSILSFIAALVEAFKE